jgi:hypothetical protein
MSDGIVKMMARGLCCGVSCLSKASACNADQWRDNMRAVIEALDAAGYAVVRKDEAADEIERLRAENERMREALEGISKIPRSENAYGIIQVFARAALEEGKK